MTPNTTNKYERTRKLQVQAQLLLSRAVQARARAIRVRHDARLGRLRRYMPEANSLTRAITATILDTHGLWEAGPIP
jgi:hypothetical protein